MRGCILFIIALLLLSSLSMVEALEKEPRVISAEPDYPIIGEELKVLLEQFDKGEVDPDENVTLLIYFKDQSQMSMVREITSKYETEKIPHKNDIKEILKKYKPKEKKLVKEEEKEIIETKNVEFADGSTFVILIDSYSGMETGSITMPEGTFVFSR